MSITAFKKSWLIIAAVIATACADSATSSRLQPTAPSFASRGLGACPDLVADGELTFHAYASGAQIYRWDGAAWVFIAPRATLYADPGLHGVVGSHSAGPTWKSVSGSTVVAAVAKRCTPNQSAIPWLLLDATSSAGPGVFRGVSHIQRLNISGGVAPAAGGNTIGEIAEVPYTAEYLFFRRD